VLGLESTFGFLVRPTLENVAAAPNGAAVCHEQHAFARHLSPELLEKRVHTLTDLREAFTARRSREEWSQSARAGDFTKTH